ncbi:LuxR family transcriptional regulator [Actinomadura sp. 7K534]|uniref:helix-turn-helix transcriptional regulator n=1 Tax=Actinomadura sp. 7K534 TaxID=2530366 RepID=UPI00104CA7FB|nr:LuxR family transcriptional regulator [Actinomadura sp. 7K534]TDB97058.1 helix-turn-helix transcriptional regulator [Actinomadura sp. 7K534]
MGTLSGRTPLLNRHRERAELDGLLGDVRSGRGRALVLRGEAGVGKSALLRHTVGRAADMRVVRTVGAESEMELAFAGLHLLLAPLLDRIETLPGPQRDALTVAFGLRKGDAPDRFMIGLAVLTLLAEAAEERAMLCVVDDAQWLDQSSAQVLAFVARRLLAEPVGLIFAAREPGRHFHGLVDLEVRGLAKQDAHALLRSVVRFPLDERIKDRILAETNGNPLALLELPRGLSPAQLAGGFGLVKAQAVPARVEESFRRRLAALPAETRSLMLVAAVEPTGDPVLIRRAAGRLGVSDSAGEPAEADGLLEIGAWLRFRHPLVRSAVYSAASSAERRAAHGALAAATDPTSDPERRAWHRAHAALEPDESVAGELELLAGRAQVRGGIAAAAAFLRRATELTPDPVRRGGRALAAAQTAFDAGAPDQALELLVSAERDPLTELQSGRVVWLRAQIIFARKRGGEALRPLLEAAGRLAHVDAGQAREAYIDAMGSAVFAGRLGQPGLLRTVAEAARTAPAGPLPARPADALLDGLVARFAEGFGEAAPRLKRVLRVFRQEARRNPDDNMRWLWLTYLVAADMWDDQTLHELAEYAVQAAREIGALHFLPQALTYRAAVHVYAGQFDAAATVVEESDAILEVTGNSYFGFASNLLRGWRGGPEAPAQLEAAAEWASSWGEGRAISACQYMSALAYNAFGRYKDALDYAERAWGHDDLGVTGFASVELIEAAAYGKSPEAATAALRQLEERATASGTDWALGLLARSKALLSDGQAADLLYREAIERLQRSRAAVYLARTHLVYGEWLRREKRRLDAREHLRTAHEMLRRFGATAFADRAQRELLATGETVRKRTAGTPGGGLTPQEEQIARLARTGLSNPEIGAQLFLSPRTVEYHLSKVFAKLAITSRQQLAEALPDLDHDRA